MITNKNKRGPITKKNYFGTTKFKKYLPNIEFEEDIASLETFMYNIEANGKLLRTVLKDAKAQGKKAYVYGASTKGNTMLQLWNLEGLFEGAAEIHPDKIGRYTVGTKIPIISEEEAREKADIFFVPNFGFRDMFS